MEERLELQDWQDAIFALDAVNLSGVVHAWHRALPRIWNEARAAGCGTDYLSAIKCDPLDTALEMLHVAVSAIKKMSMVSECTVESDSDSGEAIFSVKNDPDPKHYFVLKLMEG